MRTIYCAKFRDDDENPIKIDFLESKIVSAKCDECLNIDLKNLISENEKNTYRKNKLIWMFNTAMYNFSTALFEVEISVKMDFDMKTLVDSLIKYMVSLDLKEVNVRFSSRTALNVETLVDAIDEFNRSRILCGCTNAISVSYDLELSSNQSAKFLNLFSKDVKHSSVTIDIQNCPNIEECTDYVVDNTLNIYYDVAQIPMYTDCVKNQLLKFLTDDFENINIFPINKLNIPVDIYNEALKMFFEENNINNKLERTLSTNLFESVCNSTMPNNFIIDSFGNIRKCRHNNNSQTVIGTIINGEFEIDFSKFLKWTTPNHRLIYKKGCVDCFYYPCCYGAACKYFELNQNELYCPQKFQHLMSRLIEES